MPLPRRTSKPWRTRRLAPAPRTFLSGPGTGLGKDYTVFATVDGRVVFEHVRKDKKRVRVEAEAAAS